MSTNAAFKLQDAGFTRQQVEALGEFLDTQAATKTDLIEAKTELKAEIAEAKTDILKAVLAIVISAATLNAIAVFGAMFGLAKLLGH